MHLSKLHIPFAFLALSLSVCLFAQNNSYDWTLTKEKIASFPQFTGANMCPYHYVSVPDTPAPDGYSPFYISHISRHGSRFDSSASKAEKTYAKFKQASEKGLLTPLGMELFSHVKFYMDTCRYQYEMLSRIGRAEHENIAARMFERFPSVFSNVNRNEVFAASSTKNRCLQSCSFFVMKLKQLNPKFNILLYSGDTTMQYIAKSSAYKEKVDDYKEEMKGIEKSIDLSRLMPLTFNDTDAAHAILQDDNSFFRSLIGLGCTFNTIGASHNLLKYFTVDELFADAKIRNSSFYLRYGGNAEIGYWRNQSALPLVADIIEKADEAMGRNSRRAVDLRFSHDTAILPLMGLLGLGPCKEGVPFAKAHETLAIAEVIPMAGNLQFIFYRNSKDNVLVKVLMNEREVSIKGVKAVSGPYYDWSEVRQLWSGFKF